MDFVYSVAHELRSPLVNIRALAFELRLVMQDLEPLKAGSVSIDSDQAGRIAAVISRDVPGILEHLEECVSRMVQSLSQLTQISRAALACLECCNLNCAAIANRVVARLLRDQGEDTASVEVSEIPLIYADPIAVEQIFTHLLQNALQYSVPGRPRRVKVTGWREEEQVCICVEDNGRGIAEDDLGRVFAPFRRVGPIDSKGDGMGLPLVKALLQRQGGDVYCESRIGEGSRFFVTFSKAETL